jgi:hypothetical protein
VAARSKACVCGRSLADISGSNTAGCSEACFARGGSFLSVPDG